MWRLGFTELREEGTVKLLGLKHSHYTEFRREKTKAHQVFKTLQENS